MNQLSCAVAKLIDPMPHLVGGDHPAFKLVAARNKAMPPSASFFPPMRASPSSGQIQDPR
jgi:hypothetical protein